MTANSKNHHETNCPSNFMSYSSQFDTLNQFLRQKIDCKSIPQSPFPSLPTGTNNNSNSNPLIDFTFRHLIINFRWTKSLNSFNNLDIADQVSDCCGFVLVYLELVLQAALLEDVWFEMLIISFLQFCFPLELTLIMRTSSYGSVSEVEFLMDLIKRFRGFQVRLGYQNCWLS